MGCIVASNQATCLAKTCEGPAPSQYSVAYAAIHQGTSPIPIGCT